MVNTERVKLEKRGMRGSDDDIEWTVQTPRNLQQFDWFR